MLEQIFIIKEEDSFQVYIDNGENKDTTTLFYVTGEDDIFHTEYCENLCKFIEEQYKKKNLNFLLGLGGVNEVNDIDSLIAQLNIRTLTALDWGYSTTETFKYTIETIHDFDLNSDENGNEIIESGNLGEMAQIIAKERVLTYELYNQLLD